MLSNRSLDSLKIISLLLLVAIALFALPRTIFSKNARQITEIEFEGEINASKDISAIGFVGKYLVLGADEGNRIQVLSPQGNNSSYQVFNNIELPINKEFKAEIDIEGIAVTKNTVYVTGSHSLNKKKEAESSNRRSVYRFELSPDTGQLKSTVEQGSLQAILEQDKTLSQFAKLKHQKNGVDIEGIAVKDELLYFGFRTPVLQDSYVPVIAVKFADLSFGDRYVLSYVNLDGGGIRDIVAVNEGFLILADRIDGNKDDYGVYFWDGSNSANRSQLVSNVKLIREIPTPKNIKAEGITVLQETTSTYQILVVYDGIAKGNPTVFDLKK